MATPIIARNKPVDATTLDGVALQWANGHTEGRVTIGVGRFAPLVGWHIEVGKDEEIDQALSAAKTPRGEIKHRRDGAAAIVQHWMLGEHIRFYPLTAGPPYTSVKLLVAKAAETAAAGLGVRWPQGENSRLAVRGYLGNLLEQKCAAVVTIGTRSHMTDALLGALLSHCAACEQADALVDRVRHAAIVGLHELALPLGPGEEEEWGKGDTASVVPLVASHPATLDVDYIRTMWRTANINGKLETDWAATLDWARRYTMGDEETRQTERRAYEDVI